MDHSAVNMAFERHLTSYLSRDACLAIEADFGPDVAQQVHDLYRAALACPVDWQRQTLDDGLAVLGAWLDEHYPWLSGAARKRLVHAFVMEWK